MKHILYRSYRLNGYIQPIPRSWCAKILYACSIGHGYQHRTACIGRATQIKATTCIYGVIRDCWGCISGFVTVNFVHCTRQAVIAVIVCQRGIRACLIERQCIFRRCVLNNHVIRRAGLRCYGRNMVIGTKTMPHIIFAGGVSPEKANMRISVTGRCCCRQH